jgi:hypothetical protein
MARKQWRKSRYYGYHEPGPIPTSVLSSKYGEFAGRPAYVIDLTGWVKPTLTNPVKSNHVLLSELGAPLQLDTGKLIHEKVKHTSSRDKIVG